MSIKQSKPYFDSDTVDKIVSVVFSELSIEKKTVNEAALRSYIQSGKNEYENGVLSGVAKGLYLATVIKDEMGYKVKPPTEQDIDEILDSAKAVDDAARAANRASVGVPSPVQVEHAITNTRASKLSHALNMVVYYGTRAKLGVEATPITSAEEQS